jgi:ATP-dependent RNA helicase SUPV3L1/SUV3
VSDDPAPHLATAPRQSADHRLVAVLGPTNTGKTHYALERMCGYATGMIGLPLRLLAREIYERMVAIKGANAVALITGEEKIIPRLPSYFVCTVEAMPLERQVDFLAVDEIQLCGDSERGYVFTDRLLNARGRHETVFLGATTFAPLFRRLFPEAEIVTRDRLSELTYSGPKKLTRLPKRSAIVAFSTETVYAIAELIRRQRGGAAVVMGSLSPKTRNAQVALFQKGEVDFLVATDAIGMGLNMDIDHVAFSALSKFDGKHTRHLTAQEIGQIAVAALPAPAPSASRATATNWTPTWSMRSKTTSSRRWKPPNGAIPCSISPASTPCCAA